MIATVFFTYLNWVESHRFVSSDDLDLSLTCSVVVCSQKIKRLVQFVAGIGFM